MYVYQGESLEAIRVIVFPRLLFFNTFDVACTRLRKSAIRRICKLVDYRPMRSYSHQDSVPVGADGSVM